MPRPRPGWVPSERELRAQGKALRKIAAEQRKIARAAGVQARNARKLARIRQKAAQDATREARASERTPSNVDRAQRAVQPQALRLPCPRHRGLVCPVEPEPCQFGYTGVCPRDT